MLSNKCKYAIIAALYLASQDSATKMTHGTEIARLLKMPVAFTVKILQELAKKDLILSSKGPKGGFYINEQIKKLPIINIVNAIDGADAFHRCGIGLHKCSDDNPCPFHETFKAHREKFLSTLSSTTIGTFCIDFNENHFLYVQKEVV